MYLITAMLREAYIAKGNAKEGWKTLLVMLDSCWALTYVSGSVQGFPCWGPTWQITIVPQLQIHPSVLCSVMLGMGQCKLHISSYQGSANGLLAGQGRGYGASFFLFSCCSFQCQHNSDWAAAAGSSLWLLSAIPEQCRWVSSEVSASLGALPPQGSP